MTFWIAFSIDLLILALLAAFVLKGMHKGFLRSLMGILSYIVAFAMAKLFSPMLAASLKDTSFMTFFAKKACGDFGDQALSSADASTAKNAIDSILSKFGGMSSDVKDILDVQEIGEASLSEIVAGIMSNLIAFLGIFIVVMMLLGVTVRLCKSLLDKVNILKKTDMILGGVVGVFNGLFWAWIIAAVFVFMYAPLSAMIPDWFTGEAKDLPLMIKIANDFNPIKWLLVGINNL